ncbi:RNA-directed RNA polymerase [Bertholletia excelsa]
MPKYNSRKRGELQEKLGHAYHSLRKEFRQTFDQMDPDFDQLNEEEKNRKYEQKASACYQVTYHPIYVKMSMDLQEPDGAGEMLLLSFSWIAVDYLTRIKIKSLQTGNPDLTKPINSLARYLADRM